MHPWIPSGHFLLWPSSPVCEDSVWPGLHGANRLASNSLLEGLVLAARAVEPSIAFRETAVSQAGPALHHATTSADFTGAYSVAK